MTLKRLLPALIVPWFILIIPLVGTLTSEEWQWGPGSFVVAWVMMAGVGVAYTFVTQRAGSVAYRLAAALALAAGFMIVWGNLAVGFIGSEDNPANLLYGGVLLIGAIGAALSRLAPAGMAHAMFATALAQFLVPVVALLVWRPDFDPGIAQVFMLNFVFVLMFLGAGALFRHAAGKRAEELKALKG